MKLKALKYFTSVKLGGNIRAGQEIQTEDKRLIKDLVDAELVQIPEQIKPNLQAK